MSSASRGDATSIFMPSIRDDVMLMKNVSFICEKFLQWCEATVFWCGGCGLAMYAFF